MRNGSFELTSVVSALAVVFIAACAATDRQFGSSSGSGGAGGAGDTTSSSSSSTASASTGSTASSSSSASSSSASSSSEASSSSSGMGAPCQGTGTWVDISTMCGGTKKAPDYCPQGKTAVSLMLCAGGESNPGQAYFTMYNFQGCPPPNGTCPVDMAHVSWAAVCCK